MPMPIKDLMGMRFGRLVVVGLHSRKPQARWLCRCDCGAAHFAYGSNLRRGVVKSCGCWRSEKISSANTKHGSAVNGRKTATYIAWAAMIGRCGNKNSKDWGNYGGRGIRVCKRWRHFLNFLDDMGERPVGKSLDRINNNGNYSPLNCRWATPKEQAKNRRPPRRIKIRET